MNKAYTAALFSAFIFPGSGHFYLKKNLSGIVLASATVLCLYFLLLDVFDIVQAINARILSGKISLNIISITEAVVEYVKNSQLHKLNILTISIMSIWLISIFDSYRLGRKEEENEQPE